jgi:adenosylcobyric acid synthase
MSARALMVLGTNSHVGKSLTVAALCRIFRHDGLKVAPFKAQNISLNSFATRDGGEIGRAQAVQAQAAGVEPNPDMNPILLKPQSDGGAQIIVGGKVIENGKSSDSQKLKRELIVHVEAAYRRLSAQYDFIVLEGAGSPVELNLKADDIVNLRMAEVANARCVLVADVDRGGIFAYLVGTYELLTPDERGRFDGFIVNKFRGDAQLLAPAIPDLEARVNNPCLGVVPYLHDHGVDDEDGVALDDKLAHASSWNASPDGSGFQSSDDKYDALASHYRQALDMNAIYAIVGRRG